MKKLSIIVPFNEGKAFLEDCLVSLAEEKLADFETILVCDHVKEDISDLIERYSEPLHLMVLETKEGEQGVSVARNMGLAAATGEYLYFIDSDDYLYEDTINILLATAEETNADIIYGKKKTSWFKRSVFLATYVEDALDDDEETDSFESAQLNEGAVNDAVTDIPEEEEEELTEEEIIETKRNTAYRRIFTKRKGIKNVSVLNILFKRSLIEENQIRFNPEIKYYADLSFMIQALEHAQLFERDYNSMYIKRKHNDPINQPALSQIVSPEKFDEYIKTYYYAISLIPEDSDLRRRLDLKIVNYYTNFFITRVRRSENDFWRKERFEAMQGIAKGMDPKLIRGLKMYKRRAIKALIKGDLVKTLRIVRHHLGWKKFRRIVRSKREIAKFLYIKKFLTMPLKEDWVMFESFFGKSYSDSPKYIYEYLGKTYPDKYKFIWVLDNKQSLPYGGKVIKRFSISYAYYLARCKYHVFNIRQPRWFRKREGEVFIETWHGTPLKRLVFDQDEVTAASPLYKQQFYKQTKAWDYLVSANDFSTTTFRSCFMYEGEMLDCGYPRNDILYAPNKDEIATNLRKKLGIPNDKKTILYAPTWRDDEFYGSGEYKFALKLDLHRMKEELGDEYVILLRTHYYIADALDVTGLEDFAFNLSKYNDISELYLMSDVCITDYSSVFFDYGNLKRPILFFVYDLDKYRDVLRGFYIDIEKEVPGPLLFTSDEVIEALKNIDSIAAEYQPRYDEFYERFCHLDDGYAAKRIVEKAFLGKPYKEE